MDYQPPTLTFSTAQIDTLLIPHLHALILHTVHHGDSRRIAMFTRTDTSVGYRFGLYRTDVAGDLFAPLLLRLFDFSTAQIAALQHSGSLTETELRQLSLKLGFALQRRSNRRALNRFNDGHARKRILELQRAIQAISHRAGGHAAAAFLLADTAWQLRLLDTADRFPPPPDPAFHDWLLGMSTSWHVPDITPPLATDSWLPSLLCTALQRSPHPDPQRDSILEAHIGALGSPIEPLAKPVVPPPPVDADAPAKPVRRKRTTTTR